MQQPTLMSFQTLFIFFQFQVLVCLPSVVVLGLFGFSDILLFFTDAQIVVKGFSEIVI